MNRPNTVHRILSCLLVCALLIPCTAPAEAPETTAATELTAAPTPAPTPTPSPTPTPKPTATPSPTPVPVPQADLLRIHQIANDVTDSYMLTIGDTVILIDCGTNTTDKIELKRPNPVLIGYLDACGVDHIDAWFVTHWHNDHCYNVSQLVERYGNDDTIVYGVSKEYFKYLAPLPRGTYRQLTDGDRLQIGPLDIRIVGPEYRDNLSGRRNVESMNFIVTYGNIRAMFTGDYVNKTVRDRWGDLIADIDIFKFPHHAIKPLVINRFVYKLINPRVVLIPSRDRGVVRAFARNQAGLADEGVLLNITDGNVIVSTDGVNIWTATNVTPGKYPLGDFVPPRKTAE